MQKRAPLWIVILAILVLTTAFFTVSISLGVFAHSILTPLGWSVLCGSALSFIVVFWYFLPSTWSYAGRGSFALGCWIIVCSYILVFFWYMPGGEKTMSATIISGELVKNFSAPDETVRFKDSELDLLLRLENNITVSIRDTHPLLSVREQEIYFQNILQKKPKVFWTYKEPFPGIMIYKKFAYEETAH